VDWINAVLQGVLLGGVYALFAAGLSLPFRVMRLVNIAHGDLIVLAAYIALIVTQTLDFNPLLSLIIVAPVMALLGYVLQRGLLNRVVGDDVLPPLLMTFAISVFIQNGLSEILPADTHKLDTAFYMQSISAGGFRLGALPLMEFAFAVAVIGAMQWLMYHSDFGSVFRASSDDRAVVRLMGFDTAHVFGLAMAFSLAVAAVAGVLLAMRSYFDPAIGPTQMIFGFEAAAMGGLGSVLGALAGGVILGVAQTLGEQINPAWNVLAGHIAFLVILALRPQGLFPMVQA
jgi:branched-chain amino acid transport system permease protein